MTSRNRSLARISVVLPVLNEEAILPSLIADIAHQLSHSVSHWNIVLVDDGSTDASGRIMDALASQDARIQVLHLARNFGHQAAVHAGICQADGDAVIVMDSDGQDAPETISRMVDYWLDGDDVVYAVRFGRKENLAKRVLFAAFYRVLSSMASIEIPRNAGNFGLMDRLIVEQIRGLGESDRYLPGLRSWVGYRQRALPVERLARHDDAPRVRFRGLVSLAKTALFSFSRVPLHAFYLVAASLASVAILCLSWTAVERLLYGNQSPLVPLVASGIAMVGAIQSLGIAILGEYIARIYDQVRKRPMYIVARSVNTQCSNARSADAEREPIKKETRQSELAASLLLQIAELQNELLNLRSEPNSLAVGS